MTYEQWLTNVPEAFVNDPLWNVQVYRLALFLSDLAWPDVTRLVSDRRTMSLADQLYRSAGSIDANISEGYSRGTAKARATFYEYALGSARETRGWYYKARNVLGQKVTDHRLDLCTQIIRLLLRMIPNERAAKRNS